MSNMTLGEAADAVVAKLRERLDMPDRAAIPDNLDAATDGELMEMASEIVAQLRVRLDMQADTIRDAINVIERLSARLATEEAP